MAKTAMITINDLDPRKYRPESLGVLKREGNGCGLMLFGSILNRQIRLTLKSEVQGIGRNRRTYRRTWWNSESMTIDRDRLLQIKDEAIKFYDRIKNVRDTRPLYDYVGAWLNGYQNHRVTIQIPGTTAPKNKAILNV